MTQDADVDMAFGALMATATEFDPSIPEDLIRKSYAIQRRHQFDRDEHRETSLQELKNLMDEFIDAGSAK